VAHHNPPHKELFRKDFPVRVLRKYGWAHSLHFSTDEEVVRSYRNTPKDAPWFIHLAEGTDDMAAGEYKHLEKLGCTDFNKTVLIHAVALRRTEEEPIDNDNLRGVVWCPSSNLYLLGKTLIDQHNHEWTPRVNAFALGSDSRLTAEGDFLDELRVAYSCANPPPEMIWSLLKYVYFHPGFILYHISERDWMKGQPFADFIAVKTSENDALRLCTSRRADLALVVKGGVPQIGNPDVMAKFPHVHTVPATLDGVPKRIHIDLARRIWTCSLKERGLEMDEPPTRPFRLFQRR
jgi:hypothetical protein